MKLPSLNSQIFIGIFIGVLAGFYVGHMPVPMAVKSNSLYVAGIIGTLFIDLLKMILIPLVFCSIVVGIANLKKHDQDEAQQPQLKKVWLTTLLFFVSSMGLAILLALIVSNYFKPGSGQTLDMFAGAAQQFQAQQMPIADFFAHFLHHIFVNPFTALAEGNVLAVVVFALFLGIALVAGGTRFRHVLALLQEFLDIVLAIVGWVMRLAPLGIAALLYQLVATQDASLLQGLAKFVTVVVGTTLFHGMVVLPLLMWLFTRKSPLWFWRGARAALVTAFATSSSAATLPVTLRCATEQLAVKPEIAGFVIPLGATMNMDGTALYEAAAALFVANLVGVELGLVQQLVVFMTAMLASVGAPGIPSAGMVTMVMVLQSVGLPAEAIAILLPMDRLLDTLRTTVNVEGDMIGSLIVDQVVHR